MKGKEIMKRILVIIPHLKEGGGITELVYHVYSELAKKSNYKIEIIVESVLPGVKIPTFPDKIKIIHAPSFKHPLKYIFFWNRVAHMSSRYSYIHFHTDSLTKFYPYFVMMKKNNVIVHSHNATNGRVTSNKVKSVAHHVGMSIIKAGNFRRFACSDSAAKWLYRDQSYFQFNNAIDLKKFIFDPRLRKQIQVKMNLQGKNVYGHIGRFLPVKNQQRVIKIFSKISIQDPNAVLLLFGSGPDEMKIKKLVRILGIENQIYFMGFRSDVNRFLNVIDVVIFPSLFEGLPISLVEAQANGVSVFFSDEITNQVKLLPTSHSFSLNDSDENIANKVLEADLSQNKRKESIAILKQRGYDLSDMIADLDAFYSTYDHHSWRKKSIYAVD